MDIGPNELAQPERRLLAQLADRLEVSVEEVLGRLLDPERTGHVRTRVEQGRFVALSLRDLGLSAPELALGELTALSALDVSGVGLGRLDVSSLTGLVELRCAGNALTHLELGALAALGSLDCAGNRLMVLEARANPRLRELDCSGNEIAALLLAPQAPIEIVRCARNQLMVLDLGHLPALVELACHRNPLVLLRLDAPALRRLDCARCDLTELDLRGAPSLVELDASRNRLGALDVGPCLSLARVDCGRNYIEELELVGLVELVRCACRDNQLRRLGLGRHPRLDELDCADNRLRALDLSGCPALVVLSCGGNELGSLDLSGQHALCALSAAANGLRELRVTAQGLAHLLVAENDLRALDVTGFPELCRLTVDPGVAVTASASQRRSLPALRTAEPPRDLSGMDAWDLHLHARAVEGADADADLLAVVRHPRCDLGTALMIYWTNAPHYYLRYQHRDEVEDYERLGWDLLAEIEQGVAEGRFSNGEIWFDPRNDKQTRWVRGKDWTLDADGRPPARRQIPARLLAPSRAAP